MRQKAVHVWYRWTFWKNIFYFQLFESADVNLVLLKVDLTPACPSFNFQHYTQKTTTETPFIVPTEIILFQKFMKLWTWPAEGHWHHVSYKFILLCPSTPKLSSIYFISSSCLKCFFWFYHAGGIKKIQRNKNYVFLALATWLIPSVYGLGVN
jgi:hypothetical protein